VAATVTLPLTVPAAGAVSWTVGGELSQAAAVTVSAVWAERLPAASWASTETGRLAPHVSPPNVAVVEPVEPAGEPSR
jgi:hypothetical protein